MSDNYLGAIGKLSGRDNYSSWKFQMKMYLIHEDLWECITGLKASDSRKPEDLEKLSEKALAKISLAVKPNIIIHIRNAQSAKEAWESLQKAYEDSGLTRRLALLRKLFKLHLNQLMSMEKYVEAAMSIAQQLQDINAGLEDEFLGVLLNGLPGAQITSDLIKTKLIQESHKQVDNQEELVLLSKGKPRCRTRSVQIKEKLKESLK